MCLGEEMRREIEALVRVVLPTFIDEILCATFRFLIVVRTSIEIELLSSPGSMNVHHIAEPGEDRSRENDEQISHDVPRIRTACLEFAGSTNTETAEPSGNGARIPSACFRDQLPTWPKRMRFPRYDEP